MAQNRAKGGTRVAESRSRLAECPKYAFIRQTNDGRLYTLQKIKGTNRTERNWCRARPSVSAKRVKPSIAMNQGEKILETVLRPQSREDEEELDRLREDFRSNSRKQVLLGVNSQDLKCWEERPEGYLYGQQIGRGAFGAVHEACKDQNCRYVLKISFFRDDFDREIAEREIAIMEQLRTTGLTAKLVKAKMCTDRALMLMERFDMSAEQLGTKQYEQFFGKGSAVLQGSMMFTDTQIQALFELALQLSKLGVLHGDLKLDNIMYSVNGDRFVVIDFGFTGTYKRYKDKVWTARWGFTHAMGCSQTKEIPKELIPSANVWQLLVDLGTYPLILIAIQNPNSERGVDEIRLLTGLGPRWSQIMNRQALREIQKDCPQHRGDLWEARKEHAKVREALLRHIQPYFV